MRSFLLILLLTLTSFLYSQSILVNPASAPESTLNARDLTFEVLMDGSECAEIENFKLTDNPQAPFPHVNRSWGYFEKGNSNFPFESGIVLTSGYARRSIGPSSGDALSDGGFTWYGDPDIEYLMNLTTSFPVEANNATIFEFDFIPLGNEISFNYLFASEEYDPSYACSDFNDAFAFIISGPGITPDPGLSGKNIALLPNGDYVTINNVNNQYCGDDTYYVNGPFQDIKYYGRTVPLTAYAEVEAGKTYHIKLVVADASDTQYDSAVFLEAGSFDLGGTLVDLSGVELVSDQLLCDVDSYTMKVNIEATDVEFQWFRDGVEIPGATSSEYTAISSGYYEVKINSGACSKTIGVELTFSTNPITENHEEFKCTESGTYIFNLTDFNDEIGSPEFQYSYYNSYNGAENQIPADQILNFTNFELSNTEGEILVYVRVENEGCYTIAELRLKVGIGPETQPETYRICDEGADGFEEFNMLAFAAENIVVGNPSGLTFEFYRDPETTDLILNPEAFINETQYTQIIYVKIYNPALGNEACENVEILTLDVGKFPIIQPDEITVCDNLNDNFERIDLTQNQIVVTPGINTTLHYFTEIGGTEIPNPDDFEVEGPMTIYVIVRNESGTCEDLTELEIKFIEAPMAIVETNVLEECSLDDFAVYNLPSVNHQFVDDPTGLTFSYHTTFENAYNGIEPLPEFYQNTSANQIIFVRIENENNCFDIATLLLETHLVHNQLEEVLLVCDDPYEVNDGITHFDLTQMKPEIENSLMGTGYNIQYFTSFEEALTNTNVISNPAAFQNSISPQTIYARASDGNGGCAGIVDFTIEVLPVPEFTLPEFLAFCNYDVKEYELPMEFDTYTWFDSNGNIISNDKIVAFSQVGIYTLEVTSAELSCPARREVEVIFDNQPTITDIEVNEHTIKIYANGGIPPYQYSYNNGLSWGNDYIIHNIPGGIYDLIVKSKYGCISAEKTFGVLGIPNLITPNGDGRNDVWIIKGVKGLENANIKIFDRYGKIFVDRKLTDEFRWDGKYLGRPVPSGGYWYLITIENGKTISGHLNVSTR